MDEQTIVKTACQACHCECGVLVHVREGRVAKVEGDPAHPFSKGFICVKGLASPQLLYHQHRLKYPMKRVGEKIGCKWHRIAWDEALDIVTAGLEEVRKEYGPLAISTSMGTGPRGYETAAMHFAHAVGCNAMWTTHICYIPTFIIGLVTCGAEIVQERGPDYDHTNCMLIWGANPPVSHPPRGRDILRAKDRGARLIVVDPRRTNLAAKADVWLQLRPGTDAALALGMMNVIIDEGLYNREFVGKWCHGFEDLRKRVQKYTLDRVVEITWVPGEKIKEAARLYATTRPAVIHHRVAIEHQINTSQNLRCLYILIALTGNIDVKGGNLIPQYPAGLRTFIRDLEPPGRQVKRLGAEQFPLYAGLDNPLYPVSHNPTVIKAMLTSRPYPVKALLAFNNLVMNCENSKQVWGALKRLKFMVAADFFMTPTAELADVVLPAAHWLEKDEVCYMSYNNFVTVRQKAVEPLGECRDDKEVIFELARRMNLGKWFPWNTVAEFNDYTLKPMGITFADLKEKEYIIGPVRYRKYKEAGFRTPSRRVELYSYILEKNGHDPLPAYQEYPESFVSSPELAREYPLILITGGRQIGFFHSEGRQIPRLRKMCPEPMIEIHPETAIELGIGEGDWVWIETPRGQGRVKQKTKFSDGIHPQVCHAQHHWWFPEKSGPEHGCWESNINLLTSGEPPYDPVVGSTVLRGLQCRIYKV